MSTTQQQVIPSPTAPPPSPTSTETDFPSSTSTLLFGLLVSILTMFAIFMMSAFIWNRLVIRRHVIDATLITNTLHNPQRLHRPKMWDVRVMPDKQPPPWLDVKPLAAQKRSCPASPPRITQTEPPIPSWRRGLLNRLPPEIKYSFHEPIPQASAVSRGTDIPQIELSDGSNIQISLLITMPRAPQSMQGSEYCQRLHEMVFATTNVLYRDPAPS